MRCKKAISLLSIVSMLMGASSVLTQPETVSAKVKYPITTKYTYVNKKSITFENNIGNMYIDQIDGYRMLDIDGNYWYSRIIVHGIFTNNCKKKRIVPLNFFYKHFNLFQINKKAWHDLDFSGPIPNAPTDLIDEFGENGVSHVRPKKYVEFMFSADDLPTNLRKNQRVAVRAYKNAYSSSGRLATKYFKLGSIERSMSASDQELANDDAPTISKDAFDDAMNKRAAKKAAKMGYTPMQLFLNNYHEYWKLFGNSPRVFKDSEIANNPLFIKKSDHHYVYKQSSDPKTGTTVYIPVVTR